MSNPYILVIGGGKDYTEYFRKLGSVVHLSAWDKEYTHLLDDCELVVFTGGSDVDPKLYGQPLHPRTYISHYRDAQEKELYDLCSKNPYNIPMVGICRGSQFLTVMNNGSLFQHVSNHTQPHLIDALRPTSAGKKLTVRATSTHHQMMNPFDLPDDEYFIVAHANRIAIAVQDMRAGTITDYGNSSDEPIDCDPEIVLYPYTSCLAIQGHPETITPGTDAYSEYCLELIERHLCGTLDVGSFVVDTTEAILETDKLNNVLKFGNVNKSK